ncbi:unnamed protein product [Cylicostephanus goldi]|uniref:Uncharacterized protein n=1 Tax=Cylicostephanus goldi TaxID=71465 RepID=A0A3P7QZ28_CYLGO|nr:unnamed protein product [Cylicostephanus goldi]
MPILVKISCNKTLEHHKLLAAPHQGRPTQLIPGTDLMRTTMMITWVL